MRQFAKIIFLILSTSALSVHAQQDEMTVQERPTVSIEGHLTSDGKPVEDAILMLRSVSDKKNASPITTTSDVLGRYLFFGIAAGEFVLKIEKYGLRSVEQNLKFDGTNVVRLDVALVPGHLSFGKVPPGVGATEERVFYATDRRRGNSGEPYYANERNNDGKLSYGYIDVNVPSSSNSRLPLGVDADRVKNVIVDKIVEEDEREFVVEAGRGGKEALIFIHGFQNSFDYAARRLGALKHDLHFTGTAILFSWASRNDASPRGYAEDESTIDWSEPHFKQFLDDLSRIGFGKIHFIAHSMGNRLLLRGLESCSHLHGVDEVVFAAPDVDMDTFREALTRIRPLVGRLTMYGSSKDQALRLSRAIHRLPRAGLLDPILFASVLDTVDATKVDLSFIHHSYFVDATPVEEDISLVLRDKAPPRVRLTRQQNGANVLWLLQ